MSLKNSRVSFRAEENLVKALEDIADSEDVSVAHLIRHILRRSVRNRKSPVERSDNSIKATRSV